MLSYGLREVWEHDAHIIFDPKLTHNFISTTVATNLGVHDFDMGEIVRKYGFFKEKEVSAT